MRKHDGLSGAHEKVVEGLFERLYEMVIGRGKRFQLCRILDELFSRLDAESLGESSVTLTLGTLGDAFELSLFLGNGIAGTCAACHALLKVTTWTRLNDGCVENTVSIQPKSYSKTLTGRTRLVFGAGSRRMTDRGTRMLAKLLWLLAYLVARFAFSRRMARFFTVMIATIQQRTTYRTA